MVRPIHYVAAASATATGFAINKAIAQPSGINIAVATLFSAATISVFFAMGNQPQKISTIEPPKTNGDASSSQTNGHKGDSAGNTNGHTSTAKKAKEVVAELNSVLYRQRLRSGSTHHSLHSGLQ